MVEWRSWVPGAWSLVLALVMLGPALGAGHVLTYDMVWVPDLALRPDFWGLGSALPRAVPSDLVVSLADEVVPGAWLQDLVLLGALAGGGWGASRLAPASSTAARLAAVSVYEWNPFVTERLLLGHWPVLVGYAVLPWVVVAARAWREGPGSPWRLLVLVPLGSLSASAGLVTAVVLLALGWPRAWRARLGLVAIAAAANAPWLVAGLLHAADARSDGAAAEVFGLHGDGVLPAPVAGLVLGGVWNAEVVLPSRDSALAWVGVLALVVVVLAGWRPLLTRWGRRDAAALTACWAVGYLVALLTWAAPGAVAVVAEQVPGGGLVRDGSRLLALGAPLLAALTGHAVAALLARVGPDLAARAVLGATAAVLPVTLMPDAVAGLAGNLGQVSYPPEHEAARAAVERAVASGTVGDVLLLPLSSYRQPEWNEGRKVLDPTGRYLAPDFVASDVLVVDDVPVAGEDARVPRVADALEAASAGERAARLADLGIGFVVTDRSTPGASPTVAGDVLLDQGTLTVVALEDAVPVRAPVGWYVALVPAWLLYAGCWALGLLLGLRRGLGGRVIARFSRIGYAAPDD